MLARILFALGGFALGLVVALAVAGAVSHPAASRTQFESLTAERDETVAAAKRLQNRLDDAGKQNAELQTAISKGNDALADAKAGLDQLIDEKADLEAEIVRLEEEKEKLKVSAAETSVLLRECRDRLPTLGQYGAFQVKPIFTGSFSAAGRGPKAEEEIEQLSEAMRESFETLGIKVVEECDQVGSGLLVVHTQTSGTEPMACAITFAVGTQLPNGDLVFLHSGTTAFVVENLESMPFLLVGNTGKLAKIFEERWRGDRQKFLQKLAAPAAEN